MFNQYAKWLMGLTKIMGMLIDTQVNLDEFIRGWSEEDCLSMQPTENFQTALPQAKDKAHRLGTTPRAREPSGRGQIGADHFPVVARTRGRLCSSPARGPQCCASSGRLSDRGLDERTGGQSAAQRADRRHGEQAGADHMGRAVKTSANLRCRL